VIAILPFAVAFASPLAPPSITEIPPKRRMNRSNKEVNINIRTMNAEMSPENVILERFEKFEPVGTLIFIACARYTLLNIANIVIDINEYTFKVK